MSRIANNPVSLPKGVEINIQGQEVTAKGPKGEMSLKIHPDVVLKHDAEQLKFSVRDGSVNGASMAGTMRALVNNIVVGVTDGFERKLQIIGVGYRAQAQGRQLNLTLGFSHPIVYQLPDGVEVETPTQTEVLIRGCDKQRVGQVAAEIRAYRPPEPYKGKGVRYSDEQVIRKQAKKK